MIKSIAIKKHPNKFFVRKFLVLLYDCVPNMKNYCSIDKILKMFDILKVETVKNATTLFCCDTKKRERKNYKKNKKRNSKVLQVVKILKF